MRMMSEKKFSKILFIFLISTNIFIIIIPSNLAFWGEGDCSKYHGLSYIYPTYNKYADILLDGKPTEKFWSNHTTGNGTVIVPLASKINETGFFITYLNLTFVMNDDFLFILCEWPDNTTTPTGGNIFDGIFFCWNINVPNFSANFWDGMITSPMGGGNVDSWNWKWSGSQTNGSIYLASDECIQTNGWYDGFENQDIEISYNYNINESYTLEIKREIKTIDGDLDVQFDQHKLYKFNMAILNDGTHEDHAISWTYAVDLRIPEVAVISGYPIHLILIGFIATIGLILVNKFYNSKKK